MKLKFFARKSLDQLKGGHSQNFSSYRDNSLPDLMQSNPELVTHESRIEVGDLPRLTVDENDRGAHDGLNAQILYTWLSKLTPVQASDPRLWAWLSHVPFADYIAKRWPWRPGSGENTPKSQKDHVLSRYFLQSNSLASFSRHGLARLWWGAHQTVDKGRNNDLELSEVLFSHQTLQQALMERTLARPKLVARLVLDTWKRHTDQNGKPKKAEDAIKLWLKTIHLGGSITLLDACNQDRLRNLFETKLAMAINRANRTSNA